MNAEFSLKDRWTPEGLCFDSQFPSPKHESWRKRLSFCFDPIGRHAFVYSHRYGYNLKEQLWSCLLLCAAVQAKVI